MTFSGPTARQKSTAPTRRAGLGRRCALRPASCCLSAAAATNPTRDADTRPHLVRQASHTSRQIAPTQQVPHPSPSPPAHRPLAPRPMNSASATAWATAGSHSARAVWIAARCRQDNAIEHEYHNAVPATRLALDSTLQWTVYWCLSNSDTLGVCNAGAYRHRDHSWISFNAQGTDGHRFHELRTYPFSRVSPGCELHICHGRQSFPARPVKCLPPLPMEFGAPASIWAIKRNGCCIQEICHGRPKARWVVCEAQPHDSPLSLGAGKLPGEVSKASTCVSGGTA